MGERYSRLFTLPENLYAVGSPVVIAAGALLKDNQTGKMIAQLKLQNISNKAIKAATVSVVSFDTVGNPLGDPVQYQYLDLEAFRDEYFGSKSAIFLPDITTRSFTATVKVIAFVDNTVWTAIDDSWEPLSVPTAISSVHGSEFAKQFCIEYGVACKYFPISEKDLWRCACGTLNHQQENLCHSCRESFAAISKYNIAELEQNKNNRLAYERETAEINARQSRIKTKRVASIVAILICIVLTVLIFNRPLQAKLTVFNRFSTDDATIASSIPKSGDYLHFQFTLKGPLINNKTYTLTHRTQLPGMEEPQLCDWVWEDVEIGDSIGAHWVDGYSFSKAGTMVVEILIADTGEVIGRFEMPIK